TMEDTPAISAASAISLKLAPTTTSLNNNHIELDKLQEEFVCIILKQLDIDDTDDSRNLCKELMMNGRQRLVLHCDEVMPVVFDEEMEDESPLLTALKQYNEKRWSLIYPIDTWFRTFLDERKRDTSDLYEQILTKISAYGIPFSNETLFLTIHFLYQLNEEDKVKNVWQDLTTNGVQLVQEHRKKQLLIQEEKHDSTLLLALEEYFREPLLTLFKKCNIPDKRNLYSIAPTAVAEKGWLDGVNTKSVKGLILEPAFKLLMKDISAFGKDENNSDKSELKFEDHKSSASDDNSNQKTEPSESSTIMNSSDPTQISSKENNRSIAKALQSTAEISQVAVVDDTGEHPPAYDEIFCTQSAPQSTVTTCSSPSETVDKNQALDKREDKVSQSEAIKADDINVHLIPKEEDIFLTQMPEQNDSPTKDSSSLLPPSHTPKLNAAVSAQNNTFYDKPRTSFSSDRKDELPERIADLPQSETPRSTIEEASESVPMQVKESALPKSTSQSPSEFETMASCIRARKFQLEDLVQAGELLYIQKTLKNILEDILLQYQKHKCFSLVIYHCLTPLMYLLKRQQNLTIFMKTLFSLSKSSLLDRALSQALSKVSLRMLIHILLINSNVLVSRVVMSLLSKQNPIPLLNPQPGNTMQMMPEIFYLWNFHFPTILSFGIGPCFGKSSLLNRLFMSSFEQRMKSVYFQNTIDIDFGYHFIVKRELNIADVHGQPTKEVIEKLLTLFDGFLIQVSDEYLMQNVDSTVKFLDILPKDKYRLIVVRDVQDDKDINDNDRLPKSLAIYSKWQLPDLRNQSDNEGQDLIENLRTMILNQVKTSSLQSTSNEQFLKTKRDVKRKEIRKLVNPKSAEMLRNSTTIIATLKNHLIKAATEPSEKSYPIYSLFIEWCKLTQQLTKISFYGAQSDTMFPLQDKSFKVHQELQNIKADKCGVIFEDFVDLLEKPDTLMNLDILSSDLKFEKNLFVSEQSKAGDLSVEKSLSVEVLWRNAIVCYKYQNKSKIRNLIRTSYQKYIEAGFPYEIIDGDNFCLHYEFLYEALMYFKNKRVLIISIIGPQNSGKSTLLNYMFGTLFDVRDGRCTRGIYGSLVKSNSNDFDYIMLIDTEGLSSGETDNAEYDRRIVLFCLAVSHLVIVNIKGEFDSSMKKLVTLCADSLQNVGVNRVPEPTVHFVLNQKAFSQDVQNHEEVINKLLQNLKEKKLDKVIKITKETFHTLPLGYKPERLCESDSDSSSVVRTIPDFIEKAQLLCGKLMNSATLCFQKSKTQFVDPPQWLSFANTLFDVLLKFPDLTYFVDIHEKNQDLIIREFIRVAIEKKLTLELRLKMIKGTRALTESKIDDYINLLFGPILEELDAELEDALKSHQASETIRKRAKEFLLTQFTGMKIAWRTTALQENDRVTTEALWHTGGDEMRELVEQMIKSRIKETKASAEQKYDVMWNEKVESIRKKFNEADRLQTAIKYIYPNYNSFEKKNLPAPEHILKFISSKLGDLGLSDLQREMRQIYIKQLSSYPTIEEHQTVHSAPAEWSSETINGLTYLNKKLILKLMTGSNLSESNASQMQSSPKPPLPKTRQASESTTRIGKLVSYLSNALHLGSSDDQRQETSGSASHDTSFIAPPSNYEFQRRFMHLLYNEELAKPVKNILPLLLIFDGIYTQIMNLLCENGTGVSPIDIDLVQKIVGLVNTSLKEVDMELNLFNVSLSKHASSALHTVNVVLLTKLYFKEQKDHFNQQIDILNKIKPALKSYFLRMVLPDIEMDSDFAMSSSQQISDIFSRELREKAKIIINEAVKDDKEFTREKIQQDCDDSQLSKNDVKWHIEYILSPNTVIERIFAQKWISKETEIRLKITKARDDLLDIYSDYISTLQNMLKILKINNNGSGTQFIDNSFSTPDGGSGGNTPPPPTTTTASKTSSMSMGYFSTGGAGNHLKNKGKCMASVFYSSLSNQNIKQTYSVDNIVYVLQDTAQFQALSKSKQTVIDLVKQKEIRNAYEQCSISDLFNFLEKLIEFGVQKRDELQSMPVDFINMDSDDTYRKLLSKARGCEEPCPCCARPCDANHIKIIAEQGSTYNKHRCGTGHQYRCMGGVKLEFTNESSVKMCEEIKDDDTIVTSGNQRMTWIDFKTLHNEWDFGNEKSLTAERLNILRTKYHLIWEKIGKEFCKDYYSDMVFVMKNVEPPQHFILVLDNSGSMQGKSWHDLMDAVDKFLKIRKSSPTADRISVVVFGSEAKWACCNEDIKSFDVMAAIKEKEKKVGSGTCFSTAISLINRTMETANTNKKPDTSLIHSIVFLSDGEARYPKSELDILSDKYGKSIANFWTMGLGSTDFKILAQINDKMNGTFKNITNSSELVTVYGEIASARTTKKPK
ncbi:unnamed protein product, partial [Didymodactylos carnosus]